MAGERLTNLQSAEVLVVEVLLYRHPNIDIARTLYGSQYRRHYHPDARHPLISPDPEKNRLLIEMIVGALRNPSDGRGLNPRERKYTLPSRQAEALEWRFGFRDGMLRSAPEIAERMEANSSEVNVFVKFGLAKLVHPYHLNQWLPYLTIDPLELPGFPEE